MPEQTDEKWHELCAFETRIAARLRNATRIERMRLYNEVYSAYFEAFLKVPGVYWGAEPGKTAKIAIMPRGSAPGRPASA